MAKRQRNSEVERIKRIAHTTPPADFRQRSARYGEIGGCLECDKAALEHFDDAGRWLGCSGASRSHQTRFVLLALPCSEKTLDALQVACRPDVEEEVVEGVVRRAKLRYYATPKGQGVDPNNIADAVGRRYRIIMKKAQQAGEAGITMRDLISTSHWHMSRDWSDYLEKLIERGYLTAKEEKEGEATTTAHDAPTT